MSDRIDLLNYLTNWRRDRLAYADKMRADMATVENEIADALADIAQFDTAIAALTSGMAEAPSESAGEDFTITATSAYPDAETLTTGHAGLSNEGSALNEADDKAKAELCVTRYECLGWNAHRLGWTLDDCPAGGGVEQADWRHGWCQRDKIIAEQIEARCGIEPAPAPDTPAPEGEAVQPPEGYYAIPHGGRCAGQFNPDTFLNCSGEWTDGNGNYFCCNAQRATPTEENPNRETEEAL